MRRHINIPVFIPHLGCPNQCVFCNQRTISGVKEFNPCDLVDIVENSLLTVGCDDEVEIAFFGGSFTGIDRSLMIDLLKTAYTYVENGSVTSIRCSTRPDYINKEILALLKKYGVRTIELGLQSASENVLRSCKRGHDFRCEIDACRMIVDSGFELIGQMMIGLPGATEDDELKTAQFIINSGARGARIYPTVVFKETELCEMSNIGDYIPLSIQEAVSRSAKAFALFYENNVEVIRIGLCASDNLISDTTYHSGPNHPALGELVISRYYYDRILEEAKKLELSSSDILKISVARGCMSKAIGQKRTNKNLLKQSLGLKEIIFSESNEIFGYSFVLQKLSGEI